MNWVDSDIKNIANAMTDHGIERFTRLPFYTNTKSARSVIFESNLERVKSSAKSGAIEVLKHGGRTIGCFLVSPNTPLGMPGVKGTMVSHSYSKYGITAADWIDEQLFKHTARLSGKYVSANINPTRMATLKVFEKHGFAITSIVLIGDVERALKKLMKAIDPPIDLESIGLFIEPLTNEVDVDPILKIKKREFTRNPQFGFFAASKDYLDADRVELLDSCTNPTIHGFVVKRQKSGKIVGHFSCSIAKNPLWKKSAGVEISLDKSIQGQGVAKTAYRIMLETLSKNHVKVFAGGTSQPSVLGLAKTMDRRSLAFSLFRNRKYFSSDHFEYPGR